MNDFVFELKPCYPPGQTKEKQLNKIKSEYEEVLATDNWEDRVRELFDLKQTIVGYYHIEFDDNWKEKILEQKGYLRTSYDSLKALHYFWSYWNHERKRRKFDVKLADLYWFADNNIKRIIREHDRGNEKYRKELRERFMDEHNEKIEQVQEQIEAGIYPNREVI